MSMDIFEPASKDTDVLIEKILKPLFGYESGDYENLFWAAPIQVFLSGLLVLMSLLFIFNVVKDITNTANTGQVTGGKGSLTWNIMRNTIGVALIIPIKGIAAIQVIFIWIAAQGLLMANTIYENMDFFHQSSKSFSFVSNIQGELYKSYKNAVLSNACLLSAQAHQQEGANFGLSTSKVKSNNGFTYVYSFGDKSSSNVLDRDLCGKLTVFFPLQKDKSSMLNTSSALSEIADFKILDVEKVSSQFQQIHLNNIHNMITVKARETAAEINKNVNTENFNIQLSERIVKDLQEYENKIKEEFSNVEVINSDIKQYMTKHGIAGAGAWIWAISNTQTSLTNIVNDIPQVKLSLNTTQASGKECRFFDTLFSEENEKQCGNFNKLNQISTTILSNIENANVALKNVEINIANKVVNSSSGLYETANKEQGTDADSFFKNFDFLNKVTDYLTVDKFENTNPLVAMQSMGQIILLGLQSLILILGFSSFFSSVATTLAIAIIPFLITLYVSGLAITFYFAFMPFIIWFGNLIGWIVLVAQGIIGAPIWLVSFLRNDTDSFVGKTGQGYLLVLEAFLRPSLMILALFFSFNLLSPIVSLLNFFFWFVSNSIYANTSVFLTICYYIFVICIYCVMVNKILVIVFGLVEQIPDKILQWLGSNVNSMLGNLGKQFDNMTQQSNEKLMAQAGAGFSTSSNITQNAIKQHRDTKEREAQTEAQKKAQFERELGLNNNNQNDLNNLFNQAQSLTSSSSGSKNNNESETIPGSAPTSATDTNSATEAIVETESSTAQEQQAQEQAQQANLETLGIDPLAETNLTAEEAKTLNDFNEKPFNFAKDGTASLNTDKINEFNQAQASSNNEAEPADFSLSEEFMKPVETGNTEAQQATTATTEAQSSVNTETTQQASSQASSEKMTTDEFKQRIAEARQKVAKDNANKSKA